jgi:hypothetical protein
MDPTKTNQPPPTQVVSPRPNPNANAQKGIAVARIHVEFPAGTPEHIQKATENFFNLLVGWCRLRSHVQRAAIQTNMRRIGWGKGKRRRPNNW